MCPSFRSRPFDFRSVVLVLAVCFGLAVRAQAVPPNDGFAAPSGLVEPVQLVEGSNVGATSEVGEPPIAGFQAAHSIWWSWTASVDGKATIATTGSAFDTVLAVFTGESVDALSLVAEDDNEDINTRTSRVIFTTVSGTIYHVVVDGVGGSTGAVALQFSVVSAGTEPPRITLQPQSQTVAVGGGVTLRTVATGAPPLAYQWWHDEKPIGDATNPIVTLSKLAVSESGVYRVTVSSAFGVAVSSNALVRVTAAPVIAVSPAPQVTVPTSVVRFSVSVVGLPTFAYQWYKDGVAIPLANAATLNIPWAVASDVGIYTVRVANFFGSTQSTGAGLSLSRTPTAGESAARITGIQAASSVSEGTAVSFTSFYTGETPMTFQWFLNGDLLLNATNAILRIESARPDQSGFYSVVVANIHGSSTNTTPRFDVLPLVRPFNDGFADREILEGNPALGASSTANATAEPGEPAPQAGSGRQSVWWTWTAPSGGIAMIESAGSQIYPMITVFHGTSLDSSLIVARGVSLSGLGTTRIVFQAGQGDTFAISADDYLGQGKSVQIQLGFTADAQADLIPLVVSPPAGTNVVAGSDVRFSVSATGSHPLIYEWRKDGIPLPQFAGIDLQLAHVLAADAGAYSVRVINANGSAISDNALLGVLPIAPRISSHPKDIQITEGYPLRLAVIASGTQPMEYIWSREGVPISGATNSVLIRSNATTEINGAYAVRVINSEGATNLSPVAVSVIPAPIRYQWTTLAGSPRQAGHVDGSGSEARFSSPSGIARDGAGNLLIADLGSGTIRKVSPEGRVTTLSDAVGNPVRFTTPVDIDVEPDGALLVQNESGGTTRLSEPGIRVLTGGGDWGVGEGPDGTVYQMNFGWIVRVSKDGTKTSFGTQLNSPVDIAFDGSGNGYIAEAGGGTIRKMAPDGSLTVLAGVAGAGGYSDGPGPVARLSHPNSISLDALGNIFFADEFAETIRRLGTDGVVTTVGGAYAVWGATDGAGSDARFAEPRRVLVAPDGRLYVVDTNNHTIRMGVPFVAIPTATGLGVALRNGQLELAWPQAAGSQNLEATDRLAGDSTWQAISDGIGSSGDRFVFSEPIQAGTRYYRLRRP